MSRGLGRMQLDALHHLSAMAGETYVTVQRLAMAMWGDPTRSQLVSLRRALHGLHSRGLVRLSAAALHPHECLIAWLPSWTGPECIAGTTCASPLRKRCSPETTVVRATVTSPPSPVAGARDVEPTRPGITLESLGLGVTLARPS